jgi:hypothetical protein
MPDMNYRGPNASIAYGSPADTETQLEGVIRDYYDHKPVAKVEVTIWRAGKKVSMRRSDQAGKFAFTGLSAGHYDLRVLGSGYGLESVKGLLLPRENSVFVEVPILQRNKIIVCQ